MVFVKGEEGAPPPLALGRGTRGEGMIRVMKIPEDYDDPLRPSRISPMMFTGGGKVVLTRSKIEMFVIRREFQSPLRCRGG